MDINVYELQGPWMEKDNPKSVVISRKSLRGYSHYSKTSLTFTSFLFLADYMDELKLWDGHEGHEAEEWAFRDPTYPTMHMHAVFHSYTTQNMALFNTQDSCAY